MIFPHWLLITNVDTGDYVSTQKLGINGMFPYLLLWIGSIFWNLHHTQKKNKKGGRGDVGDLEFVALLGFWVRGTATDIATRWSLTLKQINQNISVQYNLGISNGGGKGANGWYGWLNTSQPCRPVWFHSRIVGFRNSQPLSQNLEAKSDGFIVGYASQHGAKHAAKHDLQYFLRLEGAWQRPPVQRFTKLTHIFPNLIFAKSRRDD